MDRTTPSVDKNDFLESIAVQTKDNVNHLFHLWDEMGIEDRQQRMDAVYNYIDKSFARMIKEEQGHLNAIVKEIGTLQDRRCSLLRELKRTTSDCVDNMENEESLAGLQLVKVVEVLRHKIDELTTAKEEKMFEIRELLGDDAESSRRVGRTPMPFPHETILTTAEMEQLKGHTQDMKLLRRRRSAQLEEMKLEIERLCALLGTFLQSANERNMVCDDLDNCILSDDNMSVVENLLARLQAHLNTNKDKLSRMVDRIETLCKRLGYDQVETKKHLPVDDKVSDDAVKKVAASLEELEIIKREHMERFVKASRDELVNCWKKCYYGKSQRQAFSFFVTNEFTEEVLDEHEKELEKTNRYFEDNRALFLMVDNWHFVWNHKIELERRTKDPNRLFNHRTNNLLQEEKERKQVQHRLPKVEKELVAAVEDYDNANPGRPFTLDGLPFTEYILKHKSEHGVEVDNEKMARKAMKKKMVQHESVYGSRPLTPINVTAAALIKSRREGGETFSKRKQHVPSSLPALPPAKRARMQDNSIITGNLGLNPLDSVHSSTTYRDTDVISSTFCEDSKRVTRAALATPKSLRPAASAATTTTTNKSIFKTPMSTRRLVTPSSRIVTHGTTAQGRNLKAARKIPFKL